MKQDDFILIQAGMVSELKLSGNELIIYALIHGFCKDGEHEFTGSISYICEWTNLSKVTVIAILKKLISKNLIEKREYTNNNVRFCAYKIGGTKLLPVVKKFNRGGKETLPGGGKETLPNNTNIDNPNNKKEDTNVSKKESEFETLFDAFRKKYKQYGGKARGLQVEFENLKKKHKDWQEVIPMLDYALEKENEEREQATMRGDFFPVMKNLQTYINQRSWEMYSEGFEEYDPNEYHPADLKYDPQFNAYRFYGISPQLSLFDGYTDDDRPDGARVVEQFNVYVWRSDIKDWERAS